MSAPTTATRPLRNAVWLPIFAGLCASLVSIGLARFAYTPLIPQLIQAHWFVQADVVYLGAANLAGYLIGALLGHPLGKRLTNQLVLRLMLVIATLSFFACAWALSFSWFFVWRLLSGIAGGAIMVLVASTVLPHVPAARRGAASGAIFLGIGLGIAGSGTLVPALLQWGLRDTWLGLGLVAAVLTAASWFCWPQSPPAPAVAVKASEPASHEGPASGRGLRLLFAQYALMATGLVPAMVFLVDYVARGLDAGPHVAALVWVMYGIGAIVGPMVYGLLADHLGARRGIRWVLIAQALAVGALSITRQPWLLCGLAILIGSFPPGIVPLALARVHELKQHAHAQQVAWSRATVAFASFQALAGAAYSLIFNASGGHHRPLFVIASLALLLAIVLDLAARRLR
ncbi:YbfB/YjiJ family MFS transporter [Pseudomonas sp. SK3(2021)]|uniref:YbfB/YjiJ family MFS transporter n=1 Tax=Pseudomonas sp. SK3(2021) TaxID=2841064 RepID=UPI00192C42C3|nr:YbfB/YjiJ family MFS transporter [Pseudomonas sp. SK3(2021)]QQZ39862.1 YbfB/YjiJ family MFS transporter [Pseudomonas sp. SK3(2021)]